MSADRENLQLRRVQAQAYLNLSRIQREAERLVCELLVDEGLEDITPAQANAMMVLFQERRPLTARHLAKLMGLSEVTVGRFVKALVAAGWVNREPHPEDSRAMLLRPTRRARRALPRFIRVSNTLLDLAFEGLGAGEIRRIAKTTERLRRNMAREAAE